MLLPDRLPCWPAEISMTLRAPLILGEPSAEPPQDVRHLLRHRYVKVPRGKLAPLRLGSGGEHVSRPCPRREAIRSTRTRREATVRGLAPPRQFSRHDERYTQEENKDQDGDRRHRWRRARYCREINNDSFHGLSNLLVKDPQLLSICGRFKDWTH